MSGVELPLESVDGKKSRTKEITTVHPNSKPQLGQFFHSISTSTAQPGHRPGMNTFTGTSQVLFAGRLSGFSTFTAHWAERMNPTLLQVQNQLMLKRKPTNLSIRPLQLVILQWLDGVSTCKIQNRLVVL